MVFGEWVESDGGFGWDLLEAIGSVYGHEALDRDAAGGARRWDVEAGSVPAVWPALGHVAEDSVAWFAAGVRRVATVDRPVIGPWLGRLAELIEISKSQPRKQRYTVRKMWELLCDDGFAGGYTTVKDAVRELRGKTVSKRQLPAEYPELATFRLDGREHLAGVHVAETSLNVYGQLREVAYA